jgi:hypothetical protein
MGGESVLRVRLQEFMSQLDSTFFVLFFPILQATTTTAGSTLVVLRVKVAPRSHTLQRTAVKSGLENTSKRWHVSLFRNCSTAARLVSLLTSASAASGLHLNDDTTLALNQSLRTSSGSRFISLTGSSSAIASLDAAHGPRDDHLARHALWTPLQEFTLQMLPNLALFSQCDARDSSPEIEALGACDKKNAVQARFRVSVHPSRGNRKRQHTRKGLHRP